MKILVTGGAGFIGSHIVDMLIENQHEVCIIDNLSHGNRNNINNKAKFYEMDIRDKNVIDIFINEKPEILIHHAAQISVTNSINDPCNDASINILGSLNLFEAAKRTEVKKIVYPTSAAIFGEPEYLPIDEKHPLNMSSGYGASKHTIEHYLDIYKKLYNIDYISLRYSNVYGPRQDIGGEGGVVAIFCHRMLNNLQTIIYGDGEQTRDFLFVKDVAKANLIAVNTNKTGIYNVCYGDKISVNDLYKTISGLLGVKTKPIFEGERFGEVKHSYLTNEKVAMELGWKPEYGMLSGLQETIEYFKKLKV